MNIDLNLTITSIIAICAIASPILTALINNKYNFKLKKQENDMAEKRKVLNAFIQSTVNCITSFKNVDIEKAPNFQFEIITEYHKTANKLVLYFPQIADSEDLKQLNELINSGRYFYILQHLNNIVVQLSKSI